MLLLIRASIALHLLALLAVGAARAVALGAGCRRRQSPADCRRRPVAQLLAGVELDQAAGRCRGPQ